MLGESSEDEPKPENRNRKITQHLRVSHATSVSWVVAHFDLGDPRQQTVEFHCFDSTPEAHKAFMGFCQALDAHYCVKDDKHERRLKDPHTGGRRVTVCIQGEFAIFFTLKTA